MAATWGRIGRHLGESLRSTRFSCGKNVLRLGSSIIGQPLRVFIALPAAGACEFKTFQTSCIVRAGESLLQQFADVFLYYTSLIVQMAQQPPF